MTEQEIDKELNCHKKYKAYFVGVDDQQKKEFKDAKCALLISVGQKYHEGEKFNASIKLANKHFSFCNILVGDTLQRHTLRINNPNISASDSYELVKNLGEMWIERNMQYISTLTIPYKISRWDEWLKQDKYQHYSNKVFELYNNDSNYKNIIEDIAHSFLSRHNYFNARDRQIAFDLSIQYLLEESAVACLWAEDDYKFDLYPSDLSTITAYTKLVSSKGVEARSFKFRIEKLSSNPINNLKEQPRYIAAHYALKHAPGHIYWKDIDGVYLGSNIEHAQYCGVDNPSDIIGKNDEELFGSDTAALILKTDMKVITTGKEHVVEESDRGKCFLSKKIPLKDDNGKIIGVLGTSINITEQKKLEANLEKTVKELEKALDSKKTFIKNMNHEVRIPMQLILNGSQLLRDNFYSFSDQEKIYFLDGMIKATNRLNDLITNLLDMSKFNEGKFTLNLKNEDLLVLFEEIIQEFSLMYKNKITYKAFLNDITHVACDKMRIQQVLRNLLMNSIKYGGESTPIFASLSIYDEKGVKYIKCSIKDEGVGIPKEEKDNIFEPFIGSSITRDVPGSIGLGLTISKEIIQSHNGRIWIDEIKQDEIGARISFIIPV